MPSIWYSITRLTRFTARNGQKATCAYRERRFLADSLFCFLSGCPPLSPALRLFQAAAMRSAAARHAPMRNSIRGLPQANTTWPMSFPVGMRSMWKSLRSSTARLLASS